MGRNVADFGNVLVTVQPVSGSQAENGLHTAMGILADWQHAALGR